MKNTYLILAIVVVAAVIAVVMALSLERAEAPEEANAPLATSTDTSGPASVDTPTSAEPDTSSHGENGQTPGTALGVRVEAGGLTITPESVLEDSRCPLGVMCIQAGTVRLAAVVSRGNDSTTTVLALGVPRILYDKTIVLEEVAPIKRRDTVITDAEYRFMFSTATAVE
jgi:hypothetical protein